VALVEHGRFGRAAESLNLTQQALSKRVARLEQRLGRLVERRRGGIALTAAGERFLHGARRLLEVADRAVADARQAPPAPLRVDVWADVQSPARLVRAASREHPSLIVELSMRRDLIQALGALERHELDLAFGNVANLDRALPSDLSARLVTTDPIAVLVNVHGALGAREQLTPADLARHGIWWPAAGSSPEVRAFADEYARSIGARLRTDGRNLGLDSLVECVAADLDLIAPVVAGWPLADARDVRIVPLRPTPLYPWYAIWRTADDHPTLARLLRAIRGDDAQPQRTEPTWLPWAAAAG
jgi:DNA-binding transcriptional LysR family regulator